VLPINAACFLAIKLGLDTLKATTDAVRVFTAFDALQNRYKHCPFRGLRLPGHGVFGLVVTAVHHYHGFQIQCSPD